MKADRLYGGRSGWRLAASFGLIALTFAVAEVAAIQRAARLQGEVRESVENALASVELVAQLDHDAAAERLLVGQHVFERRGPEMAQIDMRIALLETRLADTARSYEPLATFPGEREGWLELVAELDGLRAPVAEVTLLSRQDHDVLAAERMIPLEREFDALGRTLRRLARVNQDAAAESQRRVERLLRASEIQQALVTLVGILATLGVGAFAIRLVHRRESQVDRYAGLLEQQVHELDAFAGRVAHDLRGPLNNVSIAGGALAHRAPGSEGTAAALRRGVQRMEAIIRDLLALARAQVGDEVCGPQEVATSVREELEPRFRSGGGELRVDVESSTVRCGQGLLQQALANLADNALKYARPDQPPRVEITGRVDGAAYELRVSDNGVGMTPEETAHLFEPFFRAGRAPDAPGTGLGLTIVKRVAEACGGTVSAQSALGQGTTFVMRLRLATP